MTVPCALVPSRELRGVGIQERHYESFDMLPR